MNKHLIKAQIILISMAATGNAWALKETGTAAEEAMNLLIGFITGKGAYFLLVIGLAVCAGVVMMKGVQAAANSIIGILIAGGLIFGAAQIFQYFWGVNVSSLLYP